VGVMRLPTALSTAKSLSHRKISCARVALAVPLAKLFDYAVPEGLSLQVGDRVVVPFGARQQIGVVLETEAESDLPAARMNPVVAVRDDAPRLSTDWLELMRFLSGYYQRPLGETIVSALPPRLRSVKPLPRKALAPPKDVSSAQFVPNHELRPEQKDAVQRIAGSGARFEAFLLHGVTGSGKTEVYLHLIAGAIERGAQSLVLVPEISLTPQLEERFRHAFPQARLAVLHSGLEDIARTGAWLQAARGEPRSCSAPAWRCSRRWRRWGWSSSTKSTTRRSSSRRACATQHATPRSTGRNGWAAAGSDAPQWNSSHPPATPLAANSRLDIGCPIFIREPTFLSRGLSGPRGTGLGWRSPAKQAGIAVRGAFAPSPAIRLPCRCRPYPERGRSGCSRPLLFDRGARDPQAG